MSFFKSKNKPVTPVSTEKNAVSSKKQDAAKKAPDLVSPAADEKTRHEIAENNPWMQSKGRHIDIYQGLAASSAQWRVATFTMLILLFLSVLGNISLAKGVKIQPYVIQVDQHGYAIPIKELDPSGVDQRFVSSQIGSFIINSRTRVSDFTAQLMFAENSYKAVSAKSNAEYTLNSTYVKEPPTSAKYPVAVQVLSIMPLSNKSYQASWTEKVLANGTVSEYGYLGTFNVILSPPTDVDHLIENPLGIYITDFNIIRSY
jgi:type IV secretory pathway TrbF-like protein